MWRSENIEWLAGAPVLITALVVAEDTGSSLSVSKTLC
jgi:hypothetical protein